MIENQKCVKSIFMMLNSRDNWWTSRFISPLWKAFYKTSYFPRTTVCSVLFIMFWGLLFFVKQYYVLWFTCQFSVFFSWSISFKVDCYVWWSKLLDIEQPRTEWSWLCNLIYSIWFPVLFLCKTGFPIKRLTGFIYLFILIYILSIIQL